MRKLMVALALVLVACGPSEFRQECERSGGHVESEFSHFLPVPITVNKVTTIQLIPQYDYECVYG